MTQLSIILILSVILGVTTSSFIIYVYLLKKNIRRLKNALKRSGNDIYNISSRMNSGNVSHKRGNLQNISLYLQKLGEQ